MDETPKEKADRLGVPLIPPRPKFPERRDVVAVCGKCGREIPPVDNYCCPHSDCPLKTLKTEVTW